MASDAPSKIGELLGETRGGDVVVLTGAGVSAESGVPTFRGSDGFWTVGSKNYRPEEMATQRFFREDPREVWHWYLYRIGCCRYVEPNPAHDALARLEARLGNRYSLVTQNVDGLHLRAGSTPARTFEIHGNIDHQRCTASCPGIQPLDPDLVLPSETGGELTDENYARLVCRDCGAPSRPHVLWFDEYYDESLFRSETALERARRMSLLVVAGTSGATTLPVMIVEQALSNGVPIVVIDPEVTHFAAAAIQMGGVHWVATASNAVPELERAMGEW